MNEQVDNADIEIFGHLLIRDTETGEVLVNQRETLLMPCNPYDIISPKYLFDDKNGAKCGD